MAGSGQHPAVEGEIPAADCLSKEAGEAISWDRLPDTPRTGQLLCCGGAAA